MKKLIFNSSVLLLSSMLVFTACNKKKDPTPSDDTAAQTQNGSDDSRASSESDAALDDANTAIGGHLSMNGARIASYPAGILSIVYDSTSVNAKTVTITYDSSIVVNGRYRFGSISAHIPSNTTWTTAGAVLTITFHNLKAVRASDGKSITLNGVKTVQNVIGGDVKSLIAGSGSVVHKVRATNMSLTFDDGTTRMWNAARTRTITRQTTYTWSTSVSGDTTVGGHANVAMWGTTRAGNAFYSIIQTPVVWSNDACQTYFAPVSGVRVLQGLDHALTITFGVDATGAAEPATTCPYGFKLDWVNAQGVSREVIRQY
jgi:hypothetical protein